MKHWHRLAAVSVAFDLILSGCGSVHRYASGGLFPAHRSHLITFAGRRWVVKTATTEPAGPGPNYFSESSSNVFVDRNGYLHLRITHAQGRWNCAEVNLTASLGYGRYTVILGTPVDALDPQVVLGLFTYDETNAAFNNREIDIEFSRWGDSGDRTAEQFVVQPPRPDSLTRTRVSGDASSRQSLTWRPDSVSFASSNSTPSTKTYTGDHVPPHGAETFDLNLWLYHAKPPQNGKEVEVIVKSFSFTP